MPYSASTAPPAIKKLPTEARNAWIKAFNAAYKQKNDDMYARRVAWSAIKKMGYSKSEDGTWSKSTAEGVWAEAELEEATFTPGGLPLDKIIDQIWSACYHYYGQLGMYSGWRVFAVYPDYVIIDSGAPYLCLYPYTIDDKDGVVVDWSQETEVMLQFVSVADQTQEQQEGVIMADLTNLRRGYLSETVSMQEAKIEGDVIKDAVLLSPGWSANGRFYPADVVAESVPLWEGIKAYGNHSKDPNRSIYEQVGYYTKPHLDDKGRIRADFNLVGEDAKKSHIRAWVEASIKEGKPLMGLSIAAIASTYIGEAEGKKGNIIKEFIQPKSVDVVTDPATDAGFQLVTAGIDMSDVILGTLTFEEWRSSHPEFEEKLRSELKAVRQDDAIKSKDAEIISLTESVEGLRTKIDTLTEKLAEQDEVNRKLAEEKSQLEIGGLVTRLLEESRLPEVLHEDLREELVAAASEEKIKTIIGREVSKVQKVTGRQIIPASGNGQGSSSPSGRDDTFARKVFAYEGISPLPGEGAEEYRARREAMALKSNKSVEEEGD